MSHEDLCHLTMSDPMQYAHHLCAVKRDTPERACQTMHRSLNFLFEANAKLKLFLAI